MVTEDSHKALSFTFWGNLKICRKCLENIKKCTKAECSTFMVRPWFNWRPTRYPKESG